MAVGSISEQTVLLYMIHPSYGWKSAALFITLILSPLKNIARAVLLHSAFLNSFENAYEPSSEFESTSLAWEVNETHDTHDNESDNDSVDESDEDDSDDSDDMDLEDSDDESEDDSESGSDGEGISEDGGEDRIPIGPDVNGEGQGQDPLCADDLPADVSEDLCLDFLGPIGEVGGEQVQAVE